MNTAEEAHQHYQPQIDMLIAEVNEKAARIRELETQLNEAVELLNKDLAAYKSESPVVTAEIEDFLTRFESDAKTDGP